MAIKPTVIMCYLCIRPNSAAPTQSKIEIETSQYQSGWQNCVAMYIYVCALIYRYIHTFLCEM